MPVTADEFRSALSRFASGVTVVTTKDKDGNLFGITVSAFCSVSLRPPLVLVCIEKTTASHPAFGESGNFVVNILSERQIHLSDRFATPLYDKFEDVDCTVGEAGIPYLNEALANLECTLQHAYDGGDHSIFVGLVDRVHLHPGNPLIYFRSNYRNLEDDPLA